MAANIPGFFDPVRIQQRRENRIQFGEDVLAPMANRVTAVIVTGAVIAAPTLGLQPFAPLIGLAAGVAAESVSNVECVIGASAGAAAEQSSGFVGRKIEEKSQC